MYIIVIYLYNLIKLTFTLSFINNLYFTTELFSLKLYNYLVFYNKVYFYLNSKLY